MTSASHIEVAEFIKRRFPEDSNWTTGNCYYFALILSVRFNGDIYYDTVNGHFVTKIGKRYYDYYGIAECIESNIIKWDEFDKYDYLLQKRIVRDCTQ